MRVVAGYRVQFLTPCPNLLWLVSSRWRIVFVNFGHKGIFYQHDCWWSPAHIGCTTMVFTESLVLRRIAYRLSPTTRAVSIRASHPGLPL